MKAEQENYDQWAWLYDQTMGPEYGQEKMEGSSKDDSAETAGRSPSYSICAVELAH